METLAPGHTASSSTEPELHLLVERDHKDDWRRWRSASAGSVAFHILVVTVLLTVREGPYRPPPPEQILVRHVTPLIIPPDLTQKAPNKGPVKKDLTLESIAPHPAIKAPSPAPAAKQTQPPPKPMPAPPAQVTQATPKPVVIEPPKIDAAIPKGQPTQIANAQLPPPPGSGAPKIVLEDVAPPHPTGSGKPTGGIAMPGTSVADALRAITRGGSAGPSSIGQTIYDEGSGPGLNLPASAGQPRAGLQLRSDPMGVDFKPYMIQVMAAIRRNWFAVYPEAAKLGMRGQVSLQFRVAKQGVVAKVVFNGQSNAKALDQAAVAAISASNPLPPLPPEFKGDHIDLQMTFLYNMPR